MTYEEWRRSKACRLMSRVDLSPHDIIWSSDMTDEEKAAHPEYEITGYFLRKRDITQAYNEWWSKLAESEKDIIRGIENFDAEKFTQITGIKA